MKRYLSVPVFAAILVLCLVILGAGGEPQPASAQLTETEPSPPAETIVVRLYIRDRAHLDAVAGQLDIWEVHYDQGYAVAAVTAEQYTWLQDLGYRLEIDAEKTARLAAPLAPLDPRFYYFDDNYPNANGRYVVDFLQDTASAYPTLTQLFDIGDAWQASHSGHHRDIWVLRISNEDPAYGAMADKPAFFLFATIHAREVAVPELAIRYIKYLTEGYNGEGGYNVDPDVTWLVNHNVAYVLLMQNPDGHRQNEQNTGAYRRKNMDNDDGCTNPGDWGVDLNRNSSFKWGCCGGSSSDPCGETYRGPSRASEPETQAFQSFFVSVMEDQNGPNGDDELPPAAPDDATGLFISLHSYSDLILWPYGFAAGTAPNNAQLRTIGRKFAYYNGYDPSGDIYTVDGATDDWTYGKFGIASYTFEVGSGYGTCGGFFPPYGCLEGLDGMGRNFWAENKPAFLFAHKIARTPYVTAYGPDAEALVVVPPTVQQGEPLQLTATIADHRYGGDALRPIAAAEYFIDAPGADGTGAPLSPTDGAWDETSEGVQAAVDTAGLSLGRHYLLVHGRNDDGDWGPLTAIFLTVTFAPDGAITGVVREALHGAPVDQADVALLGGLFDQFTTTGPDGIYAFAVYSDTYTLRADAYGYYPATWPGIAVQTGLTVTQNITLSAMPTGALTGRVTQAGTGLPLEAAITAVSDYATLETSSDPDTGLYHLSAFSDAYTVTAQTGSHQPATVPDVLVSQGQTTTHDFVLSPQTCVLLVDDDGGQSYEGYFQTALEQSGILYQPWSIEDLGSPSVGDLGVFPTVLWFTGDDSTFEALTDQDRANLTSYLQGGGALFLTGAEIGVANQYEPFYTNVLRSHFDDDDSRDKALTGGGPFAGLSISLAGGDGANNQTWPDALSPIAPATRVFTYSNGLGGAVAVDTGEYRALNLGFGVEGVNKAADRKAVIEQGLTWLGCPPFPIDLQLTKSATPDPVAPGAPLTYTLVLTNNSLISTTNLLISDTLPAHTILARTSAGGLVDGGLVSWQISALDSLATLRLTLVVTVGQVASGTAIVNADYGLRADQLSAVAYGPPLTVTTCGAPLPVYHIYLPLIHK